MKRRSFIQAAGLGALLAAARGLAAAPPGAAAAINMAGRQRMLTQRIVKAYCQIGLEVLPEASRRQLGDAVALFEQQLAELTASAPGGAVAELGRRWPPFRSLATGPVNRDGARRLLEQDAALLAAAQRLTLELQARSPAAAGRLVNIAGRQRMLSQRLAKLYMLRAWEIGAAALEEEMESARNEFSGALAALRAAPENSEAVARELEAAALQWEWFQNALAQDANYKSYRLVVADASEALLASMEGITASYEQLATS